MVDRTTFKQALFVFWGMTVSLFSIAQKKKDVPTYMTSGKLVYMQYCVTCHQVDGAGAPNMIPPLIKTEYVLGPKDRIVKILLNGINGEIKVNGDTYSGEMPSHAFLKDEEISTVLSYVRNSFGNKGSVVSASEVKRLRRQNTTVK